MIWRALGVLAVMCLLVSGCASSAPPVQFDSNQLLHLVSPNDVRTLDPAKIHQPSVELSLARNIFDADPMFPRHPSRLLRRTETALCSTSRRSRIGDELPSPR